MVKRPEVVRDIAGKTFGLLTVLGDKPVGIRRKVAVWLCRCECGTVGEFPGSALNTGKKKSCGCLVAKLNTATKTTHGKSKTRTYRIWAYMLQRCHGPRAAREDRYGKRGIAVCAEWRESFERFLEDMGEAPDGMSIDRRDNDGDYCKDNCRWATTLQQNRNRSCSKVLTHDGRTMSIKEWATVVGLTYHTIWNRIKAGWSVCDAITTGLMTGTSRKARRATFK